MWVDNDILNSIAFDFFVKINSDYHFRILHSNLANYLRRKKVCLKERMPMAESPKI